SGDVERDSERRLELQRELAVALSELEPSDRTVLVLRYLEELPTRELAARLELAEPAARKRVSRALERLRDVLDRRSGGNRSAWSLALAGLVAPRRARAAASVATTGGTALLLSKATWTLVAAAALGALFLGARLWLAAGPAGPAPVARAAPQLVEPKDDPVALERDGSSIGDASRSVLAAQEIATEQVARVRVVDAEGAPVPEAKLAWVDTAGEVASLVLDADATCAIPEDSGEARFFAFAEGRGGGFARASNPGDDLELGLQGTRSVLGRVVEDGGAPRAPILLHYGFISKYPGIAPSESHLLESLRSVGAAPPYRATTTRPDGTFVLEGLALEGDQILNLPSTHRTIAVDGSSMYGTWGSQRIPSDGREFVLETARMPWVVGRMVWDDTSEPVQGIVSLVLRSKDSSNEMSTGERLDERGGFAVGIPVEPHTLGGSFEARCAAVTCDRLRIWPVAADAKALIVETVVELTDVEYPLDIGTLRIPRAPMLHVRVTGPEGESVSGAAVASELASGTTDAEGLVTIAARPGRLLALAVDHALSVIEWDGASTSESAPLELTLPRGATLEVLHPPSGLAADWSACSVRIAWEVSPFEGAGLESAGGPSPTPDGVFRELFGRRWFSGGFRHAPGLPGTARFDLLPERSLLIPGWQAMGVARLELLDAAENAVGSVDLHVPSHPRRFIVDLGDLIPPCGRLELRALDPRGLAVEQADFALSKDGRYHVQFVTVEGDTFVLEPVALGTYVVTVRARGYMTQEFEGLEVRGQDEVHEVVLEPARRLDVSLVDASGVSLSAQVVEVRGQGRRWEPNGFYDETVGVVRFSELPLEALELSARIGAHTWTQTIDAEQTSLALDLPPHGQLTVRASARELLTSENGKLAVHLRALDGEDALEHGTWVSGSGRGPTQATYDLLPGRYALEVDLEEFPPGAREGDAPLLTPLLRREVEVRAGETC
ncbi:MAG TPA: sigma factor-like helix-turn-helix DNA-binding protein, partial [Planctomycetota bacterium]|nr:sigma factor-like helix-turn-helix DNA-binding protein [Planctomycetota bacterium]